MVVCGLIWLQAMTSLTCALAERPVCGRHRLRQWDKNGRVGEATNPGPQGITIVSQNVDGLYPRLQAALSTKADIYAWQESDVGAANRSACWKNARDLGYSLTTSLASAEDNGEGTDERRQGKVAIATRSGISTFALTCQDSDTLTLAESGRWHERYIPVRDGGSFIIVASLYGYSGSSASPVLEKEE
jgi:hypothetical protein